MAADSKPPVEDNQPTEADFKKALDAEGVCQQDEDDPWTTEDMKRQAEEHKAIKASD